MGSRIKRIKKMIRTASRREKEKEGEKQDERAGAEENEKE
jgi:hypothetical protein